MDRVNSLLPKEEKSFILTDDERNLKQLQSTLSMLANKSSLSKDIILDVKLLGSAIQLVRARKSLKYTTDALYFESTLQCLHDCYVSQKMSSATQSRMLQVMTDLCKERKYFKNFHVDWRVFWNQSIAIATRTKKAESMASAEILVEVLTKSATFLHEARHFIQPDEVEKIVEESMAILTDTRQQGCTEGLLMLINCLPTKYAHYDTMLPIWLKLWTSIQHNVSWDACWLTLLCRARKHCPQFDWRPYVSLMLVKTKELLQLATGANVIQGRQFPLDLPEQYMRIANFRLPNRRTALYKITKLLYAAVAQGNNVRVTAYPITITPPKLDENCLFNRLDLTYPGYNAPLDDVSATAVEIGMFFQTIRHFLHASNSGQHTGNVALVLAAFAVEIGRHVGHELADALVGPSTSRAPTLPTPVHMPTVTYLNGLLTLLALEGLFGKDQSSNYQNASTLKMLMSIDPNLGHILVPILIAGLTTVNQTHQAPIALYTLNLVFRQLMFPTPVLLQYLPAILPLVLPGLDPSDSAKSVATLTFVSTVLAWLPVRAEYKLPSSTVAPVSYLSLLPTASIKLTNACDHSNPALQLAPKDLQAQYDVLAATLGSWVPLFLEKFFALLDAIEGKQEGRKVSGGIGPNMCECIGFLFQSMGTGPTAQQVQAQVLEHFRKNTPSNATKVCGKLFEYMTAARPDAVLGAVIDAFLDKDTLTPGNSSTDRVAFRLRIVGGACRGSTGSTLVAQLSKLLPYTEPAFTHHTDKGVRKASAKLLKDILKGLTAVYPTCTTPTMGGDVDSSIGKPIILKEIQWHVPTGASLSAAVCFLRTKTHAISSKLRDFFAAALSDAPEDAVKQRKDDATKGEEQLVVDLKALAKLLRGAADVLGDGLDVTPLVEDDRPLVSTARSLIIAALPTEEKEFLATLRQSMLELLVFVSDSLEQVAATAATTPAAKSFAGLVNNALVRSAWIKLLQAILTRRSASVKNPDHAIHYLSMSKRMARGSLSRALNVELKARTINGEPLRASAHLLSLGLVEFQATSLVSREYWKFHDINSNNIVNRVWVQNGNRQTQYALSSAKTCFKHAPLATIYKAAFKCLVKMCSHEYDVIRFKAISSTQALSRFYGWSRWSEDILHPMIVSLAQTGTSFYSASGALAILRSGHVVEKVAARWDLAELLLKSVLCSGPMVAAIIDNDKKEKLQIAFSEVMIQYTKAFTHVPLEDTTSAIALTSLALGALGVQDVPSTAAFTRGIRSDTYAGYVALHLIGHNDIPMQPSMWQWALQTVISTRGQPLQYLGWAAAIKLSHLSLKRDSAAQSASVIMATLFKDTLAASTTAATVSVASSTPNASVALSISVQQSSVRNGWVDFLQGVSVCHSHASSGEGNAQWTRGIAEILHSAEYLRNVFPRKMFDAKSDNNEFSSCVQAVNVGMFWSLFSLLQKAQPTLLSTAFLSQVMSASKELVFASPEEERCNNATRAELFGGLYRLVLTAPAEPRLWELDSLLTDFVTEQLEKASHEFATDYAEAIFMASVGLILPRDLKLFDLVNKGLEWVLRPPDGSVQSGDDGFTRLDNKLLLAEALLLSDNTTSVVHPGAETSFAATIATLLNASDTKVLLPYRSSRVLLSVLTSNLLLGHATQLPDMSVLWTKLRGFCAYLDADSAGDPTTMSTDAIVTDVDKLEQTRSQHALEFASNCVRSVATCAAFWRTESYLSSLVPLLLKGSGHPDLETAKMCHLTCLLIFGSAKEYLTGNGTQASAVSSGLLSYLQQCAKHSSFHVRETVATCSTLLLVGNWETMAAADRKSLKDILADGLVDDKPEVQTLARFGMVAYLCAKTGREMTTIADVYVKNSDLLAAREKAKRKSTVAGIVSVTSKAESDKNEKVYMTTIMMAACVVLTYPYDLPTFMPSLLASIVKHKSVPAMQAAVLKTVQLFKSTHQDRWEDFKVLFTNDQLTDIQGAGAAHYYS